jgi:hypothetical protein
MDGYDVTGPNRWRGPRDKVSGRLHFDAACHIPRSRKRHPRPAARSLPANTRGRRWRSCRRLNAAQLLRASQRYKEVTMRYDNNVDGGIADAGDVLQVSGNQMSGQ